MPQFNRHSGYSLVAAGLLGILFFWITDPTVGMALRWNHSENAIDLANQHLPGTIVGLVGSGLILVIGLWLSTRRSV
jgi:Na+-driven multidrug efflux pump